MNIFEQLKATRTEQFIQSIHPKTGSLSPRAGYFTIKEINYEKFGEVDIAIATINWKKSNSDYFLKDSDEKIALKSFFHNESTSGFKTTPVEDLIGKHMYIDAMGNVLEIQNKGMIKFNWGVLQKPIEFIEEHTAGLYLFFGEAKTLSQAWQNYEQGADFDIAQYLEDEANGFDVLTAGILHDEAIGNTIFQTEDVDDDLDFGDDSWDEDKANDTGNTDETPII